MVFATKLNWLQNYIEMVISGRGMLWGIICTDRLQVLVPLLLLLCTQRVHTNFASDTTTRVGTTANGNETIKINVFRLSLKTTNKSNKILSF